MSRAGYRSFKSECRWLRAQTSTLVLRAYLTLCERLPDGLFVRVARRVATRRLNEMGG